MYPIHALLIINSTIANINTGSTGTVLSSDIPLAAEDLELHDFGSNKLYLSDDELSWHDAYLKCRSYDMHLLSIPTEAKNQELFKFFKNNPQFVGEYSENPANENPNEVIYWTSGVTFAKTELEKDWSWMSTGKKLSYFSWADGQPNYDHFCIDLWYLTNTTLKWADYICSHPYPYICELHV